MSIQVLLATHNGQRFLHEQLDSLAAQGGVDVHVLALDDGSSDATLEILQGEDRLAMDVVAREEPLGLPDSFLWLLEHADPAADYFAFCDQDDIWEPDKLDAAVKALGTLPAGEPGLWVCSHRRVDAHGQAIDVPPARLGAASLGNALVECIAPGCAMVWNRALQQQLRIPEPTRIRMHDAWMYASGALLGQVLVEQRPLLRYRIHDKNAVGMNRGLTQRLRRYLVARQVQGGTIESEASELLRLYGQHMNGETAMLVRDLARKRRFRLVQHVVTQRLRRSRTVDQFLLALRLALL